MSFKKEVTKEVETGAYEISFNDNNKTATISYTEYENGESVKFVTSVTKSFDELSEKDAESFASAMAAIQVLCDTYNPENPENVVEGVE